jgi:hypothetical protein
MRANVDAQKLERLMQILGKEAQGSGCIYIENFKDKPQQEQS